MDLNRAYADHQCALLKAGRAANDTDHASNLKVASHIGQDISAYQQRLGAAAACAWSLGLFTRPATLRGLSNASPGFGPAATPGQAA